ncbi:hypothetical protein ACOMHN_007725 [Nucella lapillus]
MELCLSVSCLSAGQQQLLLGASSGRQSRGKRPTPGPLSIWTIAEVGEEDHISREGGTHTHTPTRPHDDQPTTPEEQIVDCRPVDSRGDGGYVCEGRGGDSREQTVDSDSPCVKDTVNKDTPEGLHADTSLGEATLGNTSPGETMTQTHENSPPDEPEPTSEQSCHNVDFSLSTAADDSLSRDDCVQHVFHSCSGQSDSNVSHHGGLTSNLDLTSREAQSPSSDTYNTVEPSQTDAAARANIGVATESDTCSISLYESDSETSLNISGFFKMSTDFDSALDNDKTSSTNIADTKSDVSIGDKDKIENIEDNNQPLLMSSEQHQNVSSVNNSQQWATVAAVGGKLPEKSGSIDISEEETAPARQIPATVTKASEDAKTDKMAIRSDGGYDHVTADILAHTDISTLESAMKKGGKAGGGAQVYPEHPGESPHQPQSVCSSQEELWASPPTASSSPLPSSSPARVRFSCDVIEKF